MFNPRRWLISSRTFSSSTNRTLPAFACSRPSASPAFLPTPFSPLSRWTATTSSAPCFSTLQRRQQLSYFSRDEATRLESGRRPGEGGGHPQASSICAASFLFKATQDLVSLMVLQQANGVVSGSRKFRHDSEATVLAFSDRIIACSVIV